MNEYGEVLEDGSLRFVRLLPGPIDRVWAWITEPDKRAQWFAGGETSTEAGGKVEFKFNHQNLTNHDDPFPEQYKEMEAGVEMEGTVLAYEPPHLLRILWHGPSGDTSEVTFKLTEADEGVRFELIQTGVVKRDDVLSSSAGWHTHFGIMEAKLRGDDPWPFWATHEKLVGEYAEQFKDVIERMES